MKRILVLSLIFGFTIAFGAQGDEIQKLPADEADNPILPRGLAPFEIGLPLPNTDDPTLPPDEPVRAIAEWEEVEGIFLRWGTDSYLLSQIIDYVVDVTRAYIFVSSEFQATSCLNYLSGQGVAPLDSVFFLIAPTNSVWIRDYGPWWLWRLESWDRAMYEWDYNRPRPQDDVIPEWLSHEWQIPYYGLDLTHTGGNWLVDGQGRAYCSELILQENWGLIPQGATDIFNHYCCLDSVPLTPTFFGIDHLNMSAKLLNDHTVLINEYPPGSSHNWAMDETMEVFANLTNQYGEPFEIVRILTPDWIFTPYNYCNSLIVYNQVLVPVYNMHPYDEDALAIYEEHMPGYEIHGINCSSIITLSGAINCITHNVMHPNLIHITHQRLPNTVNTTEPYLVSGEIVSLGTLDEDSLLIYWRSGISPDWNTAPLVNTTGDEYEGYIPACPGGYVDYFIYAKNVQGNWTTRPRYGPEAHFTFYAGNFNIDITLTPENPPIIIPAGGGSFNYDIDIANTGAYPIEYDGWIEAILPGGAAHQVILREGLTIAAGSSINRQMTQYIPSHAPSGNYSFNGKVGEYPAIIYDEDGFNFEKLAGESSGSELDDWLSTGWEAIKEAPTEASAEVPQDFALFQNNPNPFNSETIIGFSIPETGRVSLKVYNLGGEMVATIIEGYLPQGGYHYGWKAENLSSGIYFYRLESQGLTSVRKMMLLK